MSLKYQLTKCRWGDFEKFGYSAIVVSFFLDRVPLLLPQVALNRLEPQDPWMLSWVEARAHHGGGMGGHNDLLVWSSSDGCVANF